MKGAEKVVNEDVLIIPEADRIYENRYDFTNGVWIGYYIGLVGGDKADATTIEDVLWLNGFDSSPLKKAVEVFTERVKLHVKLKEIESKLFNLPNLEELLKSEATYAEFYQDANKRRRKNAKKAD
jgi:hypothetical protein